MQRDSRLTFWFALPLLLLLLMPTGRAFGQAVGASLNGQVVGPTGAAIPGASITLTNTGTGLALKATSSSDGAYRIAPLDPGQYKLEVQASGFERYAQNGIIITVDTAETQNVTLKIGNVQQTVNVTANAELLNTSNASLGQVINSTAITQLPLDYRTPSTLVLLAPGMTVGGNSYDQTGFSFPSNMEPSISGNGGD